MKHECGVSDLHHLLHRMWAMFSGKVFGTELETLNSEPGGDQNGALGASTHTHSHALTLTRNLTHLA